MEVTQEIMDAFIAFMEVNSELIRLKEVISRGGDVQSCSFKWFEVSGKPGAVSITPSAALLKHMAVLDVFKKSKMPFNLNLKRWAYFVWGLAALCWFVLHLPQIWFFLHRMSAL